MVDLTLIEGLAEQDLSLLPEAGATETSTAVAKVYGKPVLEVPTDLYIPPEALEVILEAFEGPLDLLLYLIRKHNLDVLDIPMADLTRQYLDYVDAMRLQQWELAAEYLLMAALLIEIKSRMLLPRPPSAQEEAEPEDPRAALVRRLLEYEQMKLAAERLLALPQAGRDFAPIAVKVERMVLVRLPDVDPEDLRQAWLGLLSRAKAAGHHKVTREQLSVREHMTRVLRSLREHPYLEFRDLFHPERGVSELVVTLLAVLELTKEYLISVTQQAVFAPIYVRLKDGNSPSD